MIIIVEFEALGLEGNCTSCFKRVVCISYRLHVDVHKGVGVGLMWAHVNRGRGGQKLNFLVDVING